MRLLKDNVAFQKPLVAQAWARILDFCRFFWHKTAPVWRSSWRLFAILCLIPTCLAGFYFTFVATDMYVSTAMFAIRDPQKSSGAADLASMFIINSSSTVSDSYLITKYVYSLDIFSKIDQRLGLTPHFSNQKSDFISRLTARPTHGEMLDYWKWALTISFDPDTGIITTKTKAYTPEMARAINVQVIDLSEALVNEMNERAHRDSLARAHAEVALAETRLTRAHEEMRRLREATTILDPRATASSRQAIIGELELEAAKVAAELTEVRTYMREDAPRVEGLQRRLEAVQAQLAQERNKLSSLTPSAGGLNLDPAVPKLSSVAADFENAQLAVEFARNQYTAALNAQEIARVQSAAKNRYLVPFQPPTLPDESLYPRPLYFTFLTLVGAMLVGALGFLIIASIREHAGF